MTTHRAIPGLLAVAIAVTLASSEHALAQGPSLSVSAVNVSPGAAVGVTIAGAPGDNYALVGSIVGAGGSYAGQPLAVGADYAVIARGVLDGSGRAVVSFTPPFSGSVIAFAWSGVFRPHFWMPWFRRCSSNL